MKNKINIKIKKTKERKKEAKERKNIKITNKLKI